MPSNPIEVWKNQQKQTTVMLNNQKIRRTWPTQEQTMSQTCSALQAKCPTTTLCLSVFHPSPRSQSQLHSSKKSLTSSFHLSPLGRSTIPVQVVLQPRHCIDKDLDLNPDLVTYDWTQLILPLLCLSFSICKMGIRMCTHLVAMRRKYVKHLALCQAGCKFYLIRI